MSDTLVVIRADNGRLHKITKICPYKDGFAALVPYHSARQGFLMKHPVMYDKRAGYMSIKDVIPYTADDRVKLSVHLSGFVQFSGVDSSKIVSGFDVVADTPKGLGTKGVTPIPASTTGPPFNITVWGIDEFDVLKGKRKNVCEFAEGDFYKRENQLPEGRPGYLVEFFLIDRNEMKNQQPSSRGSIIRKRFIFEDENIPFNLRIIDLPGQRLFLGAVAFRILTDFPSKSGFIMTGPPYKAADSAVTWGIAAMYPRAGRQKIGISLDRST